MKDWLRKRFKQFLCAHRSTDFLESVETILKQRIKDDDGTLHAPDDVESEVLRAKITALCRECSATVTISYKR